MTQTPGPVGQHGAATGVGLALTGIGLGIGLLGMAVPLIVLKKAAEQMQTPEKGKKKQKGVPAINLNLPKINVAQQKAKKQKRPYDYNVKMPEVNLNIPTIDGIKKIKY